MALSTWVSLVTNSTLNMTSSTYSFQDALAIAPIGPYANPPYPPYLFRDGCLQEDGSQNCTASCQDENKIFGSLDTLHNCMVYPTVADLYARNNFSDISLLDYYDIGKAKMNSSLYQKITTKIKSCLIDFCTVTSDCLEGLKQYDTSDMLHSPTNQTSSFYIYNSNESSYSFDFCDYVPKSFNADIGGIGVYVSYWIQTGLALVSFVLVIWWNWGIYYICLGALLLPRGYTKAQKVAQRIRNKSRNKHLPSLTGALAEFQKAQCFFMMAINIAALVNRNRGGFQPINLQQLYNTYILIKSISISGYLPVTFTLFTLHLVDVVSWYLLVLSIVTVFVSIATLFVVGNFSPSQDDLNYLSQQALSGGPDSCGKNNLAVYCYKPIGGGYGYDSADPASGAYSMLAFCLVVLILLVAHQYHAFRDPSTGQPKPWLSRINNVLFRKYNISLFRKVQIVLALISIGLNGYALSGNGDWSFDYYDDYENPSDSGAPSFVLFASCWTILFALYLFITSTAAYTRTERPIGRFFNQKIAFAVDCLSVVFWFAGFISLALFSSFEGYEGDSSVYAAVTTSTLISVCLCITFVATTVLAARHMLRTRSERSEKHALGKQYWLFQGFNTHLLQRRLSEKFLWWERLTRRVPSWKLVSRKMPSWTKHPLIMDSYTRLQQNTLPTLKLYTRRAYQDVKTHASTLDWPSTMSTATLFSIYLVFAGLYIYWFIIFIQDLEWFAYNGVDSHSWSFGQIVAISVWAEPLCEYLHLELRGMTRGFEHRLWGYTVVRIKQPDAERGITSDSMSSIRAASPHTSLDGHEMGEYGELGVVESSVKGRPNARDDEHSDRGEDGYSKFGSGSGDLATRRVPGSRDGSEEMDRRDSVGGWQIPETVILTSGSIGPL